jgi:hypothetical protein
MILLFLGMWQKKGSKKGPQKPRIFADVLGGQKGVKMRVFPKN